MNRYFRQFIHLPLLLLLMFLGGGPTSAQAEIKVVATTASLGMLAREVGGEHVDVTVLAAPDRDAHYLDARPSFMAALRRADMLVYVGADLEEGWLPAALRGASNPAINRGRDGYFRAADHLELRTSITTEGRNMGHVHAEGNPHFNVDPLRMAELAGHLSERLSRLQPDQADIFSANADHVAETLRSKAASLASGFDQTVNLVVYHEDLDYLEEWLDVSVVGYLEPAPGVPPTARHLKRLASELEGTDGVVMYAEFQPQRGADFLERTLGWSAYAVALEPQPATLAGYVSLMEDWAARAQLP